jgi:hypothetical protein
MGTSNGYVGFFGSVGVGGGLYLVKLTLKQTQVELKQKKKRTKEQNEEQKNNWVRAVQAVTQCKLLRETLKFDYTVILVDC